MSTVGAHPGPRPAVPVGPSVERWQAMNAIERERFFADVFAAFNVPAEAMTEGRPHRRAKSAALDALTLHFRSIRRTIYVADELAVVYGKETRPLPQPPRVVGEERPLDQLRGRHPLPHGRRKDPGAGQVPRSLGHPHDSVSHIFPRQERGRAGPSPRSE